MTGVEEEARRLLRWFPVSWRASHSDALIGTLLDAADADDRVALTHAERRDLILNGIRARGDMIVPEPVRERAAAIALGVGGVLATVLLFATEWTPWAHYPTWLRGVPGFGPFVSAGALVDLLWIVGAVCGLLRLRLVMAVALCLSLITSILIVVAPESAWTAYRPPAYLLAMMGTLALTACSARIRSPRLIGIAAGLTAIALAWEFSNRFYMWMPFTSFAVVQGFDSYLIGLVGAGITLLLLCSGRRELAEAVLIALGPSWLLLLLRSTGLRDLSTCIAGILIAAMLALIVVTASRFRIRLDRRQQSG